jgi:hypothetical protein
LRKLENNDRKSRKVKNRVKHGKYKSWMFLCKISLEQRLEGETERREAMQQE